VRSREAAAKSLAAKAEADFQRRKAAWSADLGRSLTTLEELWLVFDVAGTILRR